LKLSVPKKIVLIGASTGGPGQIQKIITALPKLTDTTLIIAQHMVEGFMNSFAKRLQENHHNKIGVVQNSQILKNAHIYICEGETQLVKSSSTLLFTQKVAPLNTYNPSIDIIFNSFIPLCATSKILCVILTGIGDDGVNACRDLSINGARCITESESSAIVDGMPNRARKLIPNIEIADIDTITKKISEFCE